MNLSNLNSRLSTGSSSAPPPAAADTWTIDEFEKRLCHKLLCLADQGLGQLLDAPDTKLSFADIARALEIASKFTRQASERETPAAPSAGPLEAEFKAALEKIYGAAETVEAGRAVPASLPPAT